MNKILQQVQDQLLSPVNLSSEQVLSLLSPFNARGLDYGDFYFQLSQSEHWMLEQGIVKDASYSLESGVGIRAVSGEKTGFAFSDEISKAAIEKAVKAAASISHCDKGYAIKVISSSIESPSLYTQKNPLHSLTEDDKVALLKMADEFARSVNSVISQVNVSLAGEYECVLIYATDGTIAADIRPLVRFNVHVIAEKSGRVEQGAAGFGGRDLYSVLFRPEKIKWCAEEAVRQAIVNLSAVAAPAGEMAVVLGAGWPGVLLHEAVGHGLEADFNRKGSSVYSGRLGEQVASPLCTVIDNGAMKGRRGSLQVDDEGTPTKENILIENGILKGYMQDKLNARLMEMPLTGNARRQSYACIPFPRMTNTYLAAGKTDSSTIIQSVEKGIYAVNFSGGQVDITSGQFVFTASEAYLIQNGKVGAPLKNVTLIGRGSDVLNQVSMVGNDLTLDDGIGVCGKEGQSVPVGVGQPTVKVDFITVGGTE